MKTWFYRQMRMFVTHTAIPVAGAIGALVGLSLWGAFKVQMTADVWANITGVMLGVVATIIGADWVQNRAQEAERRELAITVLPWLRVVDEQFRNTRVTLTAATYDLNRYKTLVDVASKVCSSLIVRLRAFMPVITKSDAGAARVLIDLELAAELFISKANPPNVGLSNANLQPHRVDGFLDTVTIPLGSAITYLQAKAGKEVV